MRIIKKKKADFRIVITDLNTHESKTLSLREHGHDVPPTTAARLKTSFISYINLFWNDKEFRKKIFQECKRLEKNLPDNEKCFTENIKDFEEQIEKFKKYHID